MGVRVLNPFELGFTFMKSKFSIFLVFLLAPMLSQAGIVTTNKAKIARLYAYDDYGAVEGKNGAAVFIYLSTGVSACPGSIYISPNAPGYQNLVSFTLASFMAEKAVSFQIYDDAGRQLDGRCEVDAIRME